MEKYSVRRRIGRGTYGSAYLVSLRGVLGKQSYVLKKVRLDENHSYTNSTSASLQSTAKLGICTPI
eukprot:scaffold127508_cov48-Prasinocladus_malaysianus.AAC.1